MKNELTLKDLAKFTYISTRKRPNSFWVSELEFTYEFMKDCILTEMSIGHGETSLESITKAFESIMIQIEKSESATRKFNAL